jgi:hypothetical protein
MFSKFCTVLSALLTTAMIRMIMAAAFVYYVLSEIKDLTTIFLIRSGRHWHSTNRRVFDLFAVT